MATKSFYETMVIDTPEAAASLAKAIEDYEKMARTSQVRPRAPLMTPLYSLGSWAGIRTNYDCI